MMKRGLFMLGVALLSGFLAFWFTRQHQRAEQAGILLDAMPELAWMKSELGLNDSQFSKASELHAAYRPVCVEMCAAIDRSRSRLLELAVAQRELTPALQDAIAEHARVMADCKRRMLAHLYETAALMDDDQAADYLETVLPLAFEPGGSEAQPACTSH
ncbi:MAG: hypothetical protein ACQCXQ_10975 [Verrucomicrobiales bacterium]|nr:hypothetical protein [Verrucomicrobiota bacterium JB025]